MPDSPSLKRISRSLANLVQIRSENYACVDKTTFIERLEASEAKAHVLLRPPCFGKTLFVSLLTAYYDKAFADDFEPLFEGTYIASHKTPLAGAFYVLQLSLSGIPVDDFRTGLANKIRLAILDFSLRHRLEAGLALAKSAQGDGIQRLAAFIQMFHRHREGPLFLLIDDGDCLTEAFLDSQTSAFRQVADAARELSTLYRFLTSLMNDGTVARLFISGAASLAPDALPAEFAIADNLSADPAFASVMGFTEIELRHRIPQIINPAQCGLTTDDIVQHLLRAYGGYRFSPQSREAVVHPAACLGYLSHCKRCGCPPEPTAPTIISDFPYLRRLLRHADPADANDVLQKAAAKTPIDFVAQPDAVTLRAPRLNREQLLNLLLHFGCLTHAPESRGELTVPNLAMARLFEDELANRRTRSP